MNDKLIKKTIPNSSSLENKPGTSNSFNNSITGLGNKKMLSSNVCYADGSNIGGLITGLSQKIPYTCPQPGFKSPSSVLFTKNIETYKKGMQQLFGEEKIFLTKADGSKTEVHYGSAMPNKLGKAGQYAMGILTSASAGTEGYKAIECLNNNDYEGFRSHSLKALASAGLSFLSLRAATAKKPVGSPAQTKNLPADVQPSSQVITARGIYSNTTEYMVKVSLPKMIPPHLVKAYEKAVAEPSGISNHELRVFNEYVKAANDQIFYDFKIQSVNKSVKQFNTVLVEKTLIEFDALKRAYNLTKGKFFNEEPIFGSFYEYAQNNKLAIDNKTLSRFMSYLQKN